MSEPNYLETSQGRRIAYHLTPGAGPTVVFLGGYKSDMEGTKALHLEAWALREGRAFLRFDYSGHGQSSGAFTDGCIGAWRDDALAVIEQCVQGPKVLVGSSMGGWIALLCCRVLGDIVGLVGIAAAPDFTEDGFWKGFTEAERSAVMEDGQVALPSDYGDPYIVTKTLILDGRENLVLRSPLDLPFPVRLLQGGADTSVSVETCMRLLEHMSCPDARATVVKTADHSFSSPECLRLIEAAIGELETGANA